MEKFEINWLEDRSDEALLAEIHRVASLQPDKRLTSQLFNSLSKIKSASIEKRFGSWSEAARRAGLSDALPDYSDSAILDNIRKVSEMFPDESFTSAFYITHGGLYSSSVIERRWGGWRKALDAAEIGSRYVGPIATERMRSQPGRSLSNVEILEQIRSVAARLGKDSLCGADIATNCHINQQLLWSRFGSVSAALKRAGIKQASHGRRHTEEEVYNNLLEVWTHYGRPPSHLEMDRPPSNVGSSTYIKRYGGWRKALKAFVQRANSEAAGEPAPDLEQSLSSSADLPDQTERAATSPARAGKPQSAKHIIERPRVTKAAPNNLKPEDRREPNIGIRFKVLQRDRFRCQLCGRSPATEPNCTLHVDHIIPFSRGGKTTYENLRVLCVECNVGKSNRNL